jgi:hypothetical protein
MCGTLLRFFNALMPDNSGSDLPDGRSRPFKYDGLSGEVEIGSFPTCSHPSLGMNMGPFRLVCPPSGIVMGASGKLEAENPLNIGEGCPPLVPVKAQKVTIERVVFAHRGTPIFRFAGKAMFPTDSLPQIFSDELV